MPKIALTPLRDPKADVCGSSAGARLAPVTPVQSGQNSARGAPRRLFIHSLDAEAENTGKDGRSGAASALPIRQFGSPKHSTSLCPEVPLTPIHTPMSKSIRPPVHGSAAGSQAHETSSSRGPRTLGERYSRKPWPKLPALTRGSSNRKAADARDGPRMTTRAQDREQRPRRAGQRPPCCRQVEGHRDGALRDRPLQSEQRRPRVLRVLRIRAAHGRGGQDRHRDVGRHPSGRRRRTPTGRDLRTASVRCRLCSPTDPGRAIRLEGDREHAEGRSRPHRSNDRGSLRGAPEAPSLARRARPHARQWVARSRARAAGLDSTCTTASRGSRNQKRAHLASHFCSRGPSRGPFRRGGGMSWRSSPRSSRRGGWRRSAVGVMLLADEWAKRTPSS